jgi:hypothetical protein
LNSDDGSVGGELGFDSDSTNTDIGSSTNDESGIKHVSSPLPPFSSSTLPLSTIHSFFQLSGRHFSTSSAASNTAPNAKTSLPPCLNVPAADRCKCGQVGFNKQCFNKLCKNCCIKSMNYCVVVSHKNGKPAGYQPIKYKKSTKMSKSDGDALSTTIIKPLSLILLGVVDFIDFAIKVGKAIHIAYSNCDPNEKNAKKVKPFEWICYREVFKTHCFIDNIDKTFVTHRVQRFEDQPWTVDRNITCMLFSLYVACSLFFFLTAAAPAPTITVKEWLMSIKIEQYWNDFKETGYDIIEIVKDLDDGMLDALPKKLSPGHRYLLLKKAKEIVL